MAGKLKNGDLKPEGILNMGVADPERKNEANDTPVKINSKVALELPGLIVRLEDWDYGTSVRKRQVVQIQDSVAVLGITGQGKLRLINGKFRIPTKDDEHWLVEVVAGKIDKVDGKWEDPAATAPRELKEEVCSTAKEITPRPAYYTSPGKLTEKQFPFIARGLIDGESQRELGEVFRGGTIDILPTEAKAMIEEGKVMDLKTQNLIRGYLIELMEKNAKRLGVNIEELLRPEKETEK